MKITKKQFNKLSNDQKQYIVNFIEDNDNSIDFSPPSLKELESVNLTVFLVSEPVELFEAGYVGEDVLGLSFFGKNEGNSQNTIKTIVREHIKGTKTEGEVQDALENYIKNNI